MREKWEATIVGSDGMVERVCKKEWMRTEEYDN